MNVPAIADPPGRVIRASPTLSGAVHDLGGPGRAGSRRRRAWCLPRTLRCWSSRTTMRPQTGLLPHLTSSHRGEKQFHARDGKGSAAEVVQRACDVQKFFVRKSFSQEPFAFMGSFRRPA
jgi:hypothetical protein